MHIVDIMKVYIERNNEQVELIRYRKNVDFIHVYFCEATDSMQYRPPNVNQEFSNTNHFGSFSDSLGRLSASSECMASVKNLDICLSLGIMMYLNLISTALTENILTKNGSCQHSCDCTTFSTRGQDYKEIWSMSRCSTHNLCSEMT